MNRKILVQDITKISKSKIQKDVQETKECFGNEYQNVEYFTLTGEKLLAEVK